MKILFIIISFLICELAHTQKFRDIEISDFDNEFHPTDSLAEAAFLNNSMSIEYLINEKISILVTVHKRIKVYNEDGESWAQFEVGISNDGSTRERISKIKAYTYNLENGEIFKTKLEKNQIFKEKVSDRYTLVKFALPKVKAGSIIDVKYTIQTPFIYSTPTQFFQHYIPVDKASFTITSPLIFGFTPIAKGFANFKTNEDYRTIDGREGRQVTYTVENLPAIRTDEYVLNENDFRSSLKYELRSISYPNGTTEDYSKSWQTIGEKLMENSSFGKQLTKKIKSAQPLLEEIVGLSDMDKAKRIYDYVRTNYTWNEYYGKYSEDGLKEFDKTKKGNVADFNLMLINLLLKVDLDALPFLLKSRKYGILNEGYPSLTEINYLIALVYIDGKPIFLDASSKNHPFGMLPLRAINFNGLLVDKEESKIYETNNENKFLAFRKSTYNVNLEDECLDGAGEVSYNEFASVKYRLKIKDLDEDEQNIEEEEEDDDEENEDEDSDDELLENEFEITEVSNLEDIYEKIKYEFTEKKFNCYKSIDDQIFIDCDLGLGISSNPFIELTREHPVFYNNKIDLRKVSLINIDDGFTVDSIPEAFFIALPDNIASYRYKADILNNQIIINTIFKISKPFFLPTEYAALKKFYDLIIEKHNEKIILKK